jgi:hypothetical protein
VKGNTARTVGLAANVLPAKESRSSGLTTATPDGEVKTRRWGGNARSEDVIACILDLGWCRLVSLANEDPSRDPFPLIILRSDRHTQHAEFSQFAALPVNRPARPCRGSIIFSPLGPHRVNVSPGPAISRRLPSRKFLMGAVIPPKLESDAATAKTSARQCGTTMKFSIHHTDLHWPREA